jgi:hypothetical protein
MGKLKEHGSGDAPTNHFTTIRIGGFRITHCIPGKVWIMSESGEAWSFDEKALEEAIAAFFAKEF